MALVVVAAVASGAASAEPIFRGAAVLIAEQDRLMLLDPTSGERRDLGITARSYSWSPDGKTIAYASAPTTTAPPGPLSVANADGSEPHVLVPGVRRVVAPTWSPGGRSIAFIRARGLAEGDLFVVRSDGTGLKRLVRGSWLRGPVWSPNGGLLLYQSGKPPRHHLYAFDLRRGSVRRLVDHVHYPSAPAWSPDGASISYVKRRRLFVARADGMRRRRLVDLVVWGVPRWSWDGARIAFESKRGPGQRSDVWVVAANGSTLRRLTYASDRWAQDVHPDWSPGDLLIAFVTTRNSTRDLHRQELYLMNADGSCQAPLLEGGSIPLGAPRWQPGRAVSRLACASY